MSPPRNPENPQEKELIARAREGDKDAYRLLVETYQDRVFGLALSMVRNREQAEDLTQEIFVKAYFGLESFKGDSAFFTWLYRISSNACLDFLRKHRLPEVSLDQPLGDNESATREQTLPAPRGERPEAALEEDISRLLELVSPEQRLVLSLREIEGYSYEEIGEIMKCAVNTVKSRINRAREAFKRAYEAKYGNIPPLDYVENSEENQ